ncbi:uncoupling protein 2 [Thecamonas trahens ATCC 50062]|uniref:Uncoupling protein 2 n=1 Tax=Thecamonas trahens ATCC 50062 TaxID=461836 RepID=A0A0L0DH75_THETB|nr:uncoupling protein 2 [Thecamonas trahens ATCC 50062]KNC50658.1 uncoupling protein 2 [Thecamonas trahens ATCC 50062]|eukprot:XP_013762538.1 uncoupling protein 2 [Thecamonas trahens ATCC 50062]
MFNPLDTLRIRWQVSPPGQASTSSSSTKGGEAVRAAMGRMGEGGKPSNIVAFARQVIRTEGLWRGLWKPGMLANSASIACSSGLRMGFYPLLRDWLDMQFSAGEADSEAHAASKSPAAMALASFAAGGLGYWVSTPTYQVKVRLQAEAGKVVDGVLTTGARAGSPPRYRGLFHALYTIARDEGPTALYRGAGALLIRGALITTGQLTAYDLTKTRAKAAGLLGDGPVLHVVASIVAAFFMTTLSAPADILMTRYQTAPQMGKSYRGLIHCASCMIRDEGPMVFYRGWTAFFVRLAPLNLVLFPLYEQLRRLFGLEYMD